MTVDLTVRTTLTDTVSAMSLTNTAIRNTKPSARLAKLRNGGDLTTASWEIAKPLPCACPDVGLIDALTRLDDAGRLSATDVDSGKTERLLKRPGLQNLLTA